MRQAVFSSPGHLEVTEAPIPRPGEQDVLVRVESSGVCGSDRAIFVGAHPASVPVVLGHEFAGVVTDCGAAVTDLRPGDRIVVDPNIQCGRCTYCRRGKVQLCSNNKPLGIARPGAFAEYTLVPQSNAYVLPDEVSFDDAALVEPLACCIRGIQQADVGLGATVVVLGAGPIGIMLAQLARLRGASAVVSVDPLADRRVLAGHLAADVTLDSSRPDEVRDVVMRLTGGEGADVVIEASGRTDVAQQSLDLVQPGGTVVWFGACPESDRVSVPPFWVNDREVTIRGSNINPYTHQTALALIERGRVHVSDLVSDRIELEGLATVLDGSGPTSTGKVLVKPAGVA